MHRVAAQARDADWLIQATKNAEARRRSGCGQASPSAVQQRPDVEAAQRSKLERLETEQQAEARTPVIETPAPEAKRVSGASAWDDFDDDHSLSDSPDIPTRQRFIECAQQPEIDCKWLYLDNKGFLQGPLPSWKMCTWYDHNMLNKTSQ